MTEDFFPKCFQLVFKYISVESFTKISYTGLQAMSASIALLIVFYLPYSKCIIPMMCLFFSYKL